MHYILAMSDTHCNYKLMNRIIAYTSKHHPTIKFMVHCGDMGIYDYTNVSNLSPREQHLLAKHANPIQEFYPYLNGQQSFTLPTYAIVGNHEDFVLAAKLQNDAINVNNLRLLKPGAGVIVNIGKAHCNIIGIGKVLPEGLIHRSREKYIQDSDIEAARHSAQRMGRVDILLLHEPPALEATIEMRRGKIFGSPALTKLIMDIRPRIVLAGHIHREYQGSIDNIPVFGLGYGVKGRYALLDDSFNLTFHSITHEQIKIEQVTDVSITNNIDLPLQPPKPPHTLKLPITGLEIQQLFGLNRKNVQHQQHLAIYFIALKAELAITPELDHAGALKLAYRIFNNQDNNN